MQVLKITQKQLGEGTKLPFKLCTVLNTQLIFRKNSIAKLCCNITKQNNKKYLSLLLLGKPSSPMSLSFKVNIWIII